MNATDGTDNTAVGRNSSFAFTLGSFNTSVGNNSLDKLVEGSFNSAGGGVALTALTAGDGNTAFGYSAGSNITGGSNNICIGRNATTSSATSSNELVIGNSAISTMRIPGLGFSTVGVTTGKILSWNATGGPNSTGGFQWIDVAANLATPAATGVVFGLTNNNTTNTALGVSAGAAFATGADAATTAEGNTAIGRTALFTTTTGDNNTAIGHQTLF